MGAPQLAGAWVEFEWAKAISIRSLGRAFQLRTPLGELGGVYHLIQTPSMGPARDPLF